MLQRACTWVFKQANFSQIGQYHLSSCIDNSSSSPVFTSPPPAVLVLASLRRSCFHRRSHAKWTIASPGGSIPSRLKFDMEAPCPKVCPGGPMPSQLKFVWRTHAQSTKVTLVHHTRTLVHHSRKLVHYSRAPLLFTTHILSCTTLVHHSRAPLSCTTHVVTHSLHYTRTLVHHSPAPLSCTTHVLTHSLNYSHTLVHHSITHNSHC